MKFQFSKVVVTMSVEILCNNIFSILHNFKGVKDQYKTLLLQLQCCCYGYSCLVKLFLIMFQGLAVSHECSLSVHGFAGRTVSVPNLVP